jgi:dihydrofolate reductase
VYIAASLDGFIARPDGGIDWLHSIPTPAGEDYGYADFMTSVDAVVIGRRTFDTVLTFSPWPYTKPVFVLSTTLKDPPEHLRGKVRVLSLSPPDVLRHLSSEGYGHAYVDGGKTIHLFLKEDLIDELIVTRIPILLGNGIPLFVERVGDLRFTHIETSVYANGFVKSHYRRERP